MFTVFSNAPRDVQHVVARRQMVNTRCRAPRLAARRALLLAVMPGTMRYHAVRARGASYAGNVVVDSAMSVVGTSCQRRRQYVQCRYAPPNHMMPA